MSLPRVLTVLVLISVAGRALRAQYVDLREGNRIRVQTVTHPRWTYGRFVSLDTSGLRLNSCDSCEIRSIPLPQLRGFEASTGRTGRSFALEGAVLGVTIGVVWARRAWAPATVRDDLCGDRCSQQMSMVSGGLVGLLIGTTVGALIRREHWESMPLSSASRGNR